MRTLRIVSILFALLLSISASALAQRLVDTLQFEQTTGNGTIVDLSTTTNSSSDSAIFVEWSAGTTAGVVTIEEAFDSTYTGTWSTLTTASFADDGTEVIHLAGIFQNVRARISTTVADGTVTVRFIGN